MHRLAFTLPEVGLNEVGGLVYLEDGFLVLRVVEKMLGLSEGEPHVIKVEPSAIAALFAEKKLFGMRLVIRPKKPSLLDLVPGDHATQLELRIKRSARADLADFIRAFDALPTTPPHFLEEPS